MKIYEAISLGLKNNNIKQIELANYMLVSGSTVNKWLSGEVMPAADKLIKIANYLDIIHLLFPGSEEKQNQEQIMERMREKILEMEKRLQLVELKIENKELRERAPIERAPIERAPIERERTGSISVSASKYDDYTLDDLYQIAKVTPRGRQLLSSLSEKQQRNALVETIAKESEPDTKVR